MHSVEVFGRLKKYMRRINAWPEAGKRFSIKSFAKFLTPLYIISAPVVFGLFGHVYVSIKGSHSSDIINDLLIFTFEFTSFTTAILYLRCGNQIQDLISDCGKPKYGMPKDFEKLKSQLDKNTTFIYYLWICAGLSFTVINYYFDTECYSRRNSTEDGADGYICGLACPCWFPVDVDNFWKKFVFLCDMILAIHYVPCTAPIYILAYGTVKLSVNRMEQLLIFVKGLNLAEKDLMSTKRDMKICMSYYTDIILLVEKVNNTIGLMFSPTQNGPIIILIAILEYQIVVEKSPKAVLPFIIWTLWQTVACFSGQMLEDASDRLKEELYNLPWYDMDPSLRTDFKMFHREVQNTLRLKMKPFIHLNMEYYFQVMKRSYSFLAYLKRFE